MMDKNLVNYRGGELVYSPFINYGKFFSVYEELINIRVEERSRDICEKYLKCNVFDLMQVPLMFLDENLFKCVTNETINEGKNLCEKMDFILSIFIFTLPVDVLLTYQQELWKIFENKKDF